MSQDKTVLEDLNKDFDKELEAKRRELEDKYKEIDGKKKYVGERGDYADALRNQKDNSRLALEKELEEYKKTLGAQYYQDWGGSREAADQMLRYMDTPDPGKYTDEFKETREDRTSPKEPPTIER